MKNSDFIKFIKALTLEDIKTNYSALFNSGKQFVLYGCGMVGVTSLYALRCHGYEPAYFCDSNHKKQGTQVDGLTVISPDQLKDMRDNVTVLLCLGTISEAVILMDSLNIEDYFVFNHCLIDNYHRLIDNYHWLIDNYHSIKKNVILVADSLEDDKSRELLFASLKYQCLLEYDTDFVERTCEGNQYFPKDIVNLENESFVDCGAFNGDTMSSFFENTETFSDYYAIEADYSNYIELANKIKNLNISDKVKAYYCAATNRDKTLHFQQSAHSSNSGIVDSGGIVVEGRSLDSLLCGKRVTFIKADIEGEELAMLIGSEHIIKTQNPKCAICVYHKISHLWEIPFLLKQWNPTQKLYFRLHSKLFFELVCYSI